MRYLKNVRLGDIRILSFFLFLWSAQKQLLMLSGVGKHRKASNAYNATLASVICLQKLYFNLLAWYAVSSLIILAITSNSYHSWLKKKFRFASSFCTLSTSRLQFSSEKAEFDFSTENLRYITLNDNYISVYITP